MRFVLASIGVLLLFSLAANTFFTPLKPVFPPQIYLARTIAIKDVAVHVAVADTDALRTRGLSGYAPLKADEGMLFVFEEDGIYAFWMKEMLFSIDIIWLDAAGQVVHIEKEVSPATYPASFTPGSPARYVLEVPAGFADQHDIQIGATANLEE